MQMVQAKTQFDEQLAAQYRRSQERLTALHMAVDLAKATGGIDPKDIILSAEKFSAFLSAADIPIES